MVSVSFFMQAARALREVWSKNRGRVSPLAGQAETGAAAEVRGGVQQGGRARGRRRRQHGRQRALAARAVPVLRTGHNRLQPLLEINTIQVSINGQLIS